MRNGSLRSQGHINTIPYPQHLINLSLASNKHYSVLQYLRRYTVQYSTVLSELLSCTSCVVTFPIVQYNQYILATIRPRHRNPSSPSRRNIATESPSKLILSRQPHPPDRRQSSNPQPHIGRGLSGLEAYRHALAISDRARHTVPSSFNHGSLLRVCRERWTNASDLDRCGQASSNC
jgi:hypothetical protein